MRRDYQNDYFQDEVPLVTCPSTRKPSTPTRLDECILCQTKTRLDYLSSGETGRARIVSLAKEDGGDDSRAKRILDLSMQEIELMQYHSSTCYKKFQRDMEKKKKQDSGNDVQTSSTVDAGNNEHHRGLKRII